MIQAHGTVKKFEVICYKHKVDNQNFTRSLGNDAAVVMVVLPVTTAAAEAATRRRWWWWWWWLW